MKSLKQNLTQLEQLRTFKPVCSVLIAGALLAPASDAGAAVAASAKKSASTQNSLSQTAAQVSAPSTGQSSNSNLSSAVKGNKTPTSTINPASASTSYPSSGAAKPYEAADKAVSNTSFNTLGSAFAPPPLAITINNGLNGLTEEVIPALANPDNYYFDDYMFLDNDQAACFVASIGIKGLHLHAPVNSSTVSGYFGNEGKVFTDVDLDASFSATFFSDIEVAPGFNACDVVGAIDNAFDFIVGLFGGSSSGSQTADDISYEELTLTASGLEADFDFTLELDGDNVQLKSIQELSANIGNLSYDGTALAEFLAVLAEDVIGLVVGDVTDAVNDVINQELLPTQETRVQDFVNVALEQNLSVEQSVAVGDFDATIEVAPTSLKSSKSENTMTLEFSFDIASDKVTDTCAEDLSFAGQQFGTPESTSADFDIKLPHWIMARTFHEAGRQGLFCQSMLMPLSSEPWTVRPHGTLTVENARSTATVMSSSGFPMSVVYHNGELVLTVPMVFEGDGVAYKGSASGDIKIYFKPVIPERQRLVYVEVTQIDVENVVGTLTLPFGGSVDMSDVIDTFLNSAADILTEKLGTIPLIPKTTEFAADLGIEVGVVAINDSYTTVGVNIVNLPPANDNTGGNGFDMIPVHQNRVPPLDEDDIPTFDTGPKDRLQPLP